MPKQTRTKTYCTPCKTTWNAWLDAQCPLEWGLLNPRNDCAHSMALECTTSNAGDASCCACRDGRKFISVQERFRTGYCVPCRQRWEKGNKLPPSWLVTMKDLPVRKTVGDRCVRPVAVYPSESIRGTHRGMFDQGPRYGEPRFGGAQDEGIPEDNNNSNDTTTTSPDPSNGPRVAGISKWITKPTPTTKMDWLPPDDQSINVELPAPRPDTVSYEGYKEKGPTRNPYGPRFSVPVIAPPSMASTLMSPVSLGNAAAGMNRSSTTVVGSTETASTRASTRLSETEKRRREERIGLCIGRQPKFVVPANG
ncbi:hypothetical protein B0H67DRAFT_572290 [Lasiosphaeris hirsuta]|uniref:Stc1 domain-containing protein n=1 Tax=Lasiosphaeris hirsuta TaxID=260670 RepID=A0AA40E5R3_9PEZI|nr:hypothetical protein B0H67DRAFT_572290 [Lasiosphaeris hirsuta]